MSGSAVPFVSGSPPQRLRVRSLAAIFALAFLVRMTAVLELRGSAWAEVLLGDARSYDDWGRAIAGGEWSGHEVFYQAPLYPYFLGTIYALFGRHLWLVRTIQAGLGALSAALLAAAAARLFSPRIGAWAGILFALYAPAIWFDGLLQKTSLELFLTAFLVYGISSRATWTRPARAAGLGAVLALLTLSRENAAILLIPLLGAFAFSTGERRARVGGALACALACALVLFPVGLRNARLGGAFLPTASNAGVNFYIGNGLDADGLYRPLVAGRGHPDFEREDATLWAERLAGRELSPAGVSRYWFALACHEIAQEPLHFLRLLVRKTRILCQRGEVMDAEALEVYRDHSRVLAGLWPVANFGLLLPLAVLGIAGLIRGRQSAWLLVACAAFLGLSIVLFFVTARFRIGLVPFLVPLSSAGLLALPRLLRERRAGALAAALLAALLAHFPLGTPGDPRATSYSNLAAEYMRREDFSAAERWARAAVGADPGSADAAYNLGLALRHQGRNEEAVAPLRAALRLESAYAPDVLAELGALRALEGDREGASELLRQALALDPAQPQALRYLETLRRDAQR